MGRKAADQGVSQLSPPMSAPGYRLLSGRDYAEVDTV